MKAHLEFLRQDGWVKLSPHPILWLPVFIWLRGMRLRLMSPSPGRGAVLHVYSSGPIQGMRRNGILQKWNSSGEPKPYRSEEHTSELQSRGHLVCRLLLEKKNNRGAAVATTPAEWCF